MRYRYTTEENGRVVKTAAVYTREEHGINFADVDSEAVSIVKRLKDSGHESYIVGGAVRDLILGKKPKDFDIVSDASPARIKRIFRNSRIIGRRFRLVHVYFGPRIFEVSTFRSLKDGHDGNTFGGVKDDVFRRDFTMNALFYEPGQQIVVDYVGGIKDIRAKRVKPIIPLSKIFKDDPVRMIRAVKYAAATGFSLPLPLKWKIRAESPLLGSVSPSRLTEEIFKIIHSPVAARIVEALDRTGLYTYLQPSASKLMKETPLFRSRYLRRMASLNRDGHPPADNRPPGEELGALINDYLEDTTNWEKGVTENYKESFAAARRFVLPMNPPRFELAYAVRRFFAAHGITIKKSHVTDVSGRRRISRPAEGETAGGDVQPDLRPESHSAEGAPRKKRRRKKKKVKDQPTPP
jgi:poly(A) polymerase